MSKQYFLFNKIFGHLAVKHLCKNSKEYAHCLCQCGNEVDVLVDDLLKGCVTKCSDDCKADLTGKKIGKLTVIGLFDVIYRNTIKEINGEFTDQFGNIIATGCTQKHEKWLDVWWPFYYKLTEKHAIAQNDGNCFIHEDGIVYTLREIYGIVYPNYEWVCRCECGNECMKTTKELLSSKKLSCGSCPKTNGANKNTVNPATKLKSNWSGIKQRCFNPNNTAYKNYGGRGITMYPAWIDDFQAFYDYVSTLEHFGEQGYTLDRIDPNGNYEPDNVRWADAKTQANNRRNTVFVDYYGEIIPIHKAAEMCDIDAGILYTRLRKGLKGDDLFAPVIKSLR